MARAARIIDRMLLALDIGSTNVTIGLFRAGTLVATRRAATDPRASADEFQAALDALLRLDDASLADVSSMVAASVVPTVTAAAETVAARLERPLLLATAGTVPIPVRVDRPQDVGADRLVNALAAQRLYGTPAVVVDFGTATTLDAVSANGEYLGGAICPGVSISADALFQRAARLPRIEVRKPKTVIGRTTVGAMEAGLFYGYVGMVEGLVRRMSAELALTAEGLLLDDHYGAQAMTLLRHVLAEERPGSAIFWSTGGLVAALAALGRATPR
jgi:type III pantothenate kinase